jgi:drug/metabolite transporter (DMT)-like permease
MTTNVHSEENQRESVGVLLGLAAIIVWSTSPTVVLWIGRQVGVWQYLAIGNFIGFCGQVILYRLMGRHPSALFIMPKRLWLLTVLGFVVYSLVYTGGLLTATSNAQAVGVSLMNYLWPVLTVVFSVFLVPGSRMNVRLGIAMAIGFIGLAVANWHDIIIAGKSSSALPYLLGAMAGISWALYSAFISRWRDWANRYATAPVGFLLVSLTGFIGCLLTGQWQPVSTQTWLAFLYLGLAINATGYILWELALHRAPATKLGIMGTAQPVLSTLCMLALFAFTGKTKTMPTHWTMLLLGAGLIALSVLVVSIKSKKDKDRI